MGARQKNGLTTMKNVCELISEEIFLPVKQEDFSVSAILRFYNGYAPTQPKNKLSKNVDFSFQPNNPSKYPSFTDKTIIYHLLKKVYFTFQTC